MSISFICKVTCNLSHAWCNTVHKKKKRQLCIKPVNNINKDNHTEKEKKVILCILIHNEWIFIGQKPSHTSAVSNLVFVAVRIWILVHNQHGQHNQHPLLSLSILLFFTFTFLFVLEIHALVIKKQFAHLTLKTIFIENNRMNSKPVITKEREQEIIFS